MPDVVIASQSAKVTVDGVSQWVRRGRTLAHSDHPVVADSPNLWEGLVINFPTGDTAEPAAREVRAWAKEQGLDVPERGKVPADLVEQYKAAQVEQD